MMKRPIGAVLFGGEQNTKYAGDMTNAVWLFDFDTMQWKDTTDRLAVCPE